MQTDPATEVKSTIADDPAMVSPSQPTTSDAPQPQSDAAIPTPSPTETPISTPQPLEVAQSTPPPTEKPKSDEPSQQPKAEETPTPTEPAKPQEPITAPQEPTIPPTGETTESPKPEPSPPPPAQPGASSGEPAKITHPSAAPTMVPENPEEVARKAEQEALAKLPPFYARYAELLKAYVDDKGNVDYGILRRKRGDLLEAMRGFDELDPQQVIFWTQEEKLALWLNAHNLFTLKLIVDNYPIKASVWGMWYPPNSIMQISGARDKTYFKMMGLEYTLREIERDILIKRFEDPRVCFAISYASMGGAFLRNEPYYPHRIDRQLDEQAQRFIQSPRGVQIDRDPATIQLADIFIWYRELMIAKYGPIKKFRDRPDDIRSYLNCILPYLNPDDARFIETSNPAVKFMKYDWQLNEK